MKAKSQALVNIPRQNEADLTLHYRILFLSSKTNCQ